MQLKTSSKMYKLIPFNKTGNKISNSGWFLVATRDGSLMSAWYDLPDNLFYVDTDGERYIPDVVAYYPLDNPVNHSRGTTLLLQELREKSEEILKLLDEREGIRES